MSLSTPDTPDAMIERLRLAASSALRRWRSPRMAQRDDLHVSCVKHARLPAASLWRDIVAAFALHSAKV